MKEHPILFSGPVVRAILDGRKTMTRRVVNPQPKPDGLKGVYADLYNHGSEWAFWLPDNRMTESRTWECPYGQPGDRLWVRESFKVGTFNNLVYKADQAQTRAEKVDRAFGPWKPSIHMPRWASRITLEVTGVRVERVKDITDEDAIREGVGNQEPYDVEMVEKGESYARAQFRILWDSINAKRGFGWDKNPWVWVIEFKRMV